MEAGRNSIHLLSHFDGVAPEDASASGAAMSSPGGVLKRGVAWVLWWAAALAVLCYAVAVLAEFAYSMAAEQLLARAARAGALEATLPQATVASVEQAVWRRLAGRVASARDVTLLLVQNGRLVGKRLEARGGDEFAVSVATSARAMMPDWLCWLTSWRGDVTVSARVERIVPGRKLATRASR